MSSDPISSPSTHDVFVLEGNIVCPGVAIITSGGSQKEDVQDMQQPLTRGANTIVRATKNVVVTYEIRLWTSDHFTAWNAFEAMLRDGKGRTPPRSYTFSDPRLPWLSKVIVEEIGPEMKIARGGPWKHDVTFHEWKRIRAYGGAVQAPKTQAQIDIANLTTENAGLNKQLAAAQKAAAAGI